MSKRIIRIGSAKVYPALNGLLNHEINVVLETGKTYFGRLASFTPEHLILIDTRQHHHNIGLAELYEIVYDAVQERTIK